ncbi:helix-turn-helix transcriptional regulator [Rhodococcus sp. NPDC058521]|uniref:helix-turn-helix transcriptional regulator n=1 Tax=Rhodococcus sp. NPDC058521 TaxID=3346536 RepID=UPI00365BA042
MAGRKGTVRDRNRTVSHAVLASDRRAELMDALRSSSEPQSAGELADSFSLHVSTVRFHLDALIDAGLVTAEFETNPVRGRPRRLYRALEPSAWGHQARYGDLAEVLAAHWASPGGDPKERAVEAGRQWALRGMTESDGAPRTLDAAVDSAAALFAEMGFEPQTQTQSDEIRIRLHTCPFELVARKNPSVVCSVHLGLLRGVLERAGVPGAKGTLTPWDTPHTCLARVATQ